MNHSHLRTRPRYTWDNSMHKNFPPIACSFEELSCKRPDGRPDGRTDTLTDSIVYSLFEYTKRTKPITYLNDQFNEDIHFSFNETKETDHHSPSPSFVVGFFVRLNKIHFKLNLQNKNNENNKEISLNGFFSLISILSIKSFSFFFFK